MTTVDIINNLHYVSVHCIRMKNITLSAHASMIERARKKAERHRTSLNKKFREWLEDYVDDGSEIDYLSIVDAIDHINLGGNTLSREERNER